MEHDASVYGGAGNSHRIFDAWVPIQLSPTLSAKGSPLTIPDQLDR
jgi:hypothetical protein